MAINEATGEDDANMGNISSTSDDSMKAKATKKRKELFQINTHPAATISANNKRDLRLKKIVMRVVEFCKKEHEEGLQIPFRFFKKRASVMTGVSLSTIHRIETIDMKEPEAGALEKAAKEEYKPSKKKKKKDTNSTQSQDRSAKKCNRKKKYKPDVGPIVVSMTPSIANNNNATINGNNTLSLSTLQPAVHAYAVAGTVTTAVSATINPFTANNVVSNQPAMMTQDRAACSWTTGPVGPFTMGELKDNVVPVAFATGQLDTSGWPGGTVGPFTTSVPGTTALVGHQVVQTYQATPTHAHAHAQGGRNSPVFFQF
ncbi:hypothetical protein C0Q70_16743 [Pomacea canaliculata]|uniref:Uncharacterized protein n=2 Tax=Pomacea canaliculata TaxID=400727 RepID=A0A2T7NQM6_POMCA|nr:hypothetical protein C0Q70_16743 [Pomacea canaliculata]